MKHDPKLFFFFYSTSGSGVAAGTGPDKGVSASNNRKYAGFSLANPCPSLEGSVKYKYGHLMRIETYPNGGGEVLHMWHDEIRHMSDAEQVCNFLIEKVIQGLGYQNSTYLLCKVPALTVFHPLWKTFSRPNKKVSGNPWVSLDSVMVITLHTLFTNVMIW